MNDNRSARAVLMIRPASFGFDSQTARSNVFQHKPSTSHAATLALANAEFDHAVDTLSAHGINVMVFEDEINPPKPNAVFPNNWLSTWPDGRIFLYPMATKSRRIERSAAVLDAIKKHYEVTEITDLSDSERTGQYLESTGVMVFDHTNKIVYGCVSVRCDKALLQAHAVSLGYTPIIFHAYDQAGTAIYHTNVLMGIQKSTAVICLDAVTDGSERARLMQSLETTGHHVVTITHAQMSAFCGNVLELQNQDGKGFLALSQSAYDHFTPEQRAVLSRDKTLLPLSIPTIETIGGGSVRCMLAELFLKPSHQPPVIAANLSEPVANWQTGVQ